MPSVPAVLRRRRWPRVLAAVAVALGLVAYANVALHRNGQSYQATSSLLGELQLLLHDESALQWKSLADQDAPVRIAREVGLVRSRERGIVASLAGSLPAAQLAPLRQQITAYHDVLDRELNLLAIGRTADALHLEHDQTDPLYQRLSATVTGYDEQVQASAADANNLANSVLFLALLLATSVIGWLLFRFERAHDAAIAASHEVLAQRQDALDRSEQTAALIKHQALHDALTGLPNRIMFAECLAAPGQHTVLLIDMDNFKGVNDNLGHAAGDSLLISVADRIRAGVRDCDTPARLGGDEFAVILHDATTDVASVIAQRLVVALDETHVVGGTTVRSSASIGVSASREAADADQLLREADLAMYHAKRNGKSAFALYRPEMDAGTTPTVPGGRQRPAGGVVPPAGNEQFLGREAWG